MNTGFSITQGKGFHITFANGYTVSVRFGWGNYGSNYETELPDLSQLDALNDKLGAKGADLAETAVIAPGGKFLLVDGDTVQGYRTPDQVAELVAIVSAIRGTPSEIVTEGGA
jgi:hypothetical protein